MMNLGVKEVWIEFVKQRSPVKSFAACCYLFDKNGDILIRRIAGRLIKYTPDKKNPLCQGEKQQRAKIMFRQENTKKHLKS